MVSHDPSTRTRRFLLVCLVIRFFAKAKVNVTARGSPAVDVIIGPSNQGKL